MVPLPMSSSEISRSESPAILLGTEPDRQKQIDDICEMIRNASRAGIPSVKYNLTFIGVPRTAPTPAAAAPATARSSMPTASRIRR